jgi:hypothetical protein
MEFVFFEALGALNVTSGERKMEENFLDAV